MDELIPSHSSFSDIPLQQSVPNLIHKSNKSSSISKSKLHIKPPNTSETTKYCSTCSFHRRGRWTDEEHLKFLLASNSKGNDISVLEKLLKSRTKTQIRSHKQKIDAVNDKPMNKKLREATSDFLNEKLNQAYEHLLHTEVPTSSSLFGIENGLLEEFKTILGPKINKDYVITKEDIVYVGIVLLKKEYDKVFEIRPKQTNTSLISEPHLYSFEDALIPDPEQEDPNLNSLCLTEKKSESMEAERDLIIESQERFFSTFSATHTDRSWVIDAKY